MADKPAPRYWAFISYSHADEVWGKWLHTVLESYRVPRQLVGRALGDETIPARLFPIFRDRDELPSSHELGAVINRALAGSRSLLVICSPRAATSRWVNEEIAAFRKLGLGHRIYCLIVDGEPHAADPANECFAPALRGSDGFEPIAADARPGKDGKDGAKLKLIAGILNLSLDDLRQRDRRRRFWQRIQATTASLIVGAAMLGIWQWQQTERQRDARERHLATLLEQGRAELDARHHARAAVYLHAAYAIIGNEDNRLPALRFRLARAMEPVDLAITSVNLGRNDVTFLAVTPDGNRIISSSDNGHGTVDVASLTHISIFEPPTFRVSALSTPVLSGDGRHVARVALDRTNLAAYAVVWDSERNRRVLEVPGDNIRAVALSNDGAEVAIADDSGVLMQALPPRNGTRSRLPVGPARAVIYRGRDDLVIGGRSGQVERWSRHQAQPIRRLKGMQGNITALSLSPDRRLLLAGSELGEVRLWDVESGRTLGSARHRSAIAMLGWSASGSRYLTASLDTIRAWNTADARLLLSIANPSVNLTARVSLSSQGDRLFQITPEGLAVWSVDASRILYVLDGHAARSSAFAISPLDGRLFMVGGDGRLTVWNSNSPVGQILGHPDSSSESLQDSGINVAEFDSDEKRVMTAGLDGYVRLWRASDGQALGRWRVNPSGVMSATFLDSAHVISGGLDGSMRALNLDSGQSTLLGPSRHRAAISEIRIHSKSNYVVSLSRDNVIQIWKRDKALVLQPANPGFPLKSAHLSDDGSGLILVTEDGSALWKDSVSWAIRWRYCGAVAQPSGPCTAGAARSAVSFGPWVLNYQEDGIDYLRDRASGAYIRKVPAHYLGKELADVLSPDGRFVLSCGRNGTARLRNAETGAIRELSGHLGLLQVCEIAVNGIAYTGGEEGTVVAWDAESGERLGVVASHGAGVFHARLNTRADRLLTASLDNSARIWNVGLESRPAGIIGNILRCNVPWTLQSDILVAELRIDNFIDSGRGIPKSGEAQVKVDCPGP